MSCVHFNKLKEKKATKSAQIQNRGKIIAFKTLLTLGELCAVKQAKKEPQKSANIQNRDKRVTFAKSLTPNELCVVKQEKKSNKNQPKFKTGLSELPTKNC